MKHQTKYTHITERCSSVIKAFASLRIEQQTSDTASAAYWRLREGKGLLTPFDRKSLEYWCQLITDIRRYAASPYSIDNKLRDSLKDKREYILEKMEEYRDWLDFGSLPTYMYEDAIHPEVNIITLEYCLSGMLFNLTGKKTNAIPREELKGWLSEINIQDLITLSKDYASRFPSNMIEGQLRYIMRKYDQWPKGFNELGIDRAWQIRTDMEHRSSIGARINERLYWINEVAIKTTEHREIITNDMTCVSQFKLWKLRERKSLEMARNNGERLQFNEQEVYDKVDNFLDSITIPPFSPIEQS